MSIIKKPWHEGGDDVWRVADIYLIGSIGEHLDS